MMEQVPELVEELARIPKVMVVLGSGVCLLLIIIAQYLGQIAHEFGELRRKR